MAAPARKAQLFARSLFKLSLVDGVVSAERVSGVLEYIEKHQPAHPVMVLKAYARFIAAELAKGEAVVEHAGAITPAALAALAAAICCFTVQAPIS